MAYIVLPQIGDRVRVFPINFPFSLRNSFSIRRREKKATNKLSYFNNSLTNYQISSNSVGKYKKVAHGRRFLINENDLYSID